MHHPKPTIQSTSLSADLGFMRILNVTSLHQPQLGTTMRKQFYTKIDENCMFKPICETDVNYTLLNLRKTKQEMIALTISMITQISESKKTHTLDICYKRDNRTYKSTTIWQRRYPHEELMKQLNLDIIFYNKSKKMYQSLTQQCLLITT